MKLEETLECVKCPSGQYQNKVDERDCIPARPGYRPALDQKSEEQCPPGHVSQGRKPNCTACEAHEYTNNDQSACLLCEKGQRPNENNTACLPCELGKVRLDKLQPECMDCPLGHYPSEAQDSCELCSVDESATFQTPGF